MHRRNFTKLACTMPFAGVLPNFKNFERLPTNLKRIVFTEGIPFISGAKIIQVSLEYHRINGISCLDDFGIQPYLVCNNPPFIDDMSYFLYLGIDGKLRCHDYDLLTKNKIYDTNLYNHANVESANNVLVNRFGNINLDTFFDLDRSPINGNGYYYRHIITMENNHS